MYGNLNICPLSHFIAANFRMLRLETLAVTMGGMMDWEVGFIVVCFVPLVQTIPKVPSESVVERIQELEGKIDTILKIINNVTDQQTATNLKLSTITFNLL